MILKKWEHKIHENSYVDYIYEGNVYFILYKENYSFQCMQRKW